MSKFKMGPNSEIKLPTGTRAKTEEDLTLFLERVRLNSEFIATSPMYVAVRQFAAKYRATILGECQIQLTIPRGVCIFDLLQDAQKIAAHLPGREAKCPRDAILYLTLNEWNTFDVFHKKMSEDKTLAVEGYIKDSHNMSKAKQERLKWNDVEVPELAAAHAVYLIVTGNDLFAGRGIRARTSEPLIALHKVYSFPKLSGRLWKKIDTYLSHRNPILSFGFWGLLQRMDGFGASKADENVGACRYIRPL